MQEIYRFIDDAIEADRQRYTDIADQIWDHPETRVLDKFTPDLPGYHLYYPHRRHAGSAFSLFIDRLKYKGAV